MEKRFRLLPPEWGTLRHPERLDIPLKRKKPTAWGIWNDLFHPDVPLNFIDRALEVMAACPQHIFLLLTKRANLMDEKLYRITGENPCRELGGGDYVSNIWLGVTACNQKEANDKIPLLLEIPANVRFLSLEPLLGPIDLSRFIRKEDFPIGEETRGKLQRGLGGHKRETLPIGLVIVGGETGPGARPMKPEWVEDVRDQCIAAGIPFFFKAWGPRKEAGRTLVGKEWNELPIGKPHVRI